MCTDSEQQQCVEIENRVRYAYLRGRYVYRLEEVSVHIQTSGFAMCTSQGCFCLFRGRYVYPYLYIYQAGAQRTLGAVAPPLLLLTLCALPPLYRETRAVTGNAQPRLKRQAGVSGHTIGARQHGPQWNARQLRHAMRPGRVLHDVREVHHLVSNVHHHRSRWASKPATRARCHRDSRTLIVGGRGGRRRAVTGHRRNT